MPTNGYIVVSAISAIGLAWLALMAGACVVLLRESLPQRRTARPSPTPSPRPEAAMRTPPRAATVLPGPAVRGAPA